MTKAKTPNINLGASPGRVSKKIDIDVAPGQYDHYKEFGAETKSFRIGERREEKVVETLGPGAY